MMNRSRLLTLLASFVVLCSCTGSSQYTQSTPPLGVLSSKASDAEDASHASRGDDVPSAMRQPHEKVVFHGHNELGDVFVTERGTIRCLKFAMDGGEQSCMDTGRPDRIVHEYVRMMMVGPLFAKPGARALMIGLGGGVGVQALLRADAAMTMDAVELNPLVVRVADKYFHVGESSRLRVHVGDGRAYIEHSHAHWDAIFLDAFGADFIPFSLTTKEFLVSVRNRLAPKGVVIANLWNRNEKMFAAMVKVYVEVFPKVLLIDGAESANVILIASLGDGISCRTPFGRTARPGAAGVTEQLKTVLGRCHAVEPASVASAADLVDGHRDVYDALGEF